MDKEKVLKLFFKNTAMIVDDDVFDGRTRICGIKNKFEEKGVSFVTYNNIPDRRLWGSFGRLSFLIIDWKIKHQEVVNIPGVELGDTYMEESEEEILDFISFVLENYLMPVFLFSQEQVTPIKNKIRSRTSLSTALNKKQVVVYTKRYMTQANIEDFVFNWCKENPAVYTLKTIDESIEIARNNFFKSLNSLNSQWPLVVYQTIKSDQPVCINEEFGEFLLDSLVGRIDTCEFDDEILSQEITSRNSEELVSIYSSSKLFEYGDQQPNASHTGDIYVLNGSSKADEKFWLNITAGCDLRNHDMILLKGSDSKDYDYSEVYGLINKISSNYIPLLYGHKCVEFKFKGFKQKEIKQNFDKLVIGPDTYIRVGRLIHPYITIIQERFSHYICRQGISRHPNDLLKR